MITGQLPDGTRARITLDGDRISAVDRIDDGDDQLVLPGLVDLQVNGGGGLDVNADDFDVATLRGLTDALHGRGTTAFCPTIITAPETKIIRALETIARGVREDPVIAASVIGIHVEGPYLAAVDGPRGAHDARYLRDPDPAELDRWITAADGLLRIVTLAPERHGAVDYIRAAVAAGVLISVGHCDATAEQVHRAAAAGASLSTHLGNAIQTEIPRHPNQIWAQLADDRLVAGLITDGHHLPADTVTAMVRAKGAGKSFLVSDAAALAGCAPGLHDTPVGGQVQVTEDGALHLPGTGLLAGSGAYLLDCLRWAREHTRLDRTELLEMATSTPADLIEATDRGRIRPGARADLTILDHTGQLRATIVGGQVMHGDL
ncbi:MAG: N-acetylglucosamine-6-phosphate deacetylase [Propionibacteriaceae bacterium]